MGRRSAGRGPGEPGAERRRWGPGQLPAAGESDRAELPRERARETGRQPPSDGQQSKFPKARGQEEPPKRQERSSRDRRNPRSTGWGGGGAPWELFQAHLTNRKRKAQKDQSVSK